MNIQFKNTEDYKTIKNHFVRQSLNIRNKRISLKCKLKRIIKENPVFKFLDEIILSNTNHNKSFIVKKCRKETTIKDDQVNSLCVYISTLIEYNSIRSSFETTKKMVVKDACSALKGVLRKKNSYKVRALHALKLKNLFKIIKTTSKVASDLLMYVYSELWRNLKDSLPSNLTPNDLGEDYFKGLILNPDIKF